MDSFGKVFAKRSIGSHSQRTAKYDFVRLTKYKISHAAKLLTMVEIIAPGPYIQKLYYYQTRLSIIRFSGH